MPRISSKNQVTLPVDALDASGLRAGDEVTIEATRPDELVVRRARREVEAGLGVFAGLYEPGYLDRLRQEEEERE